MRESGDWLTPRYADGTARFRKPIVAYWMVLAGFSAFEVSPMCGRLAALLCGLTTVLVVYAMTWDVWRRKDLALA